jgi:hypothetical protein
MTGESVHHRLETMTVLVAQNDQGRIIGTVGAAAHGTEGHIRSIAKPFEVRHSTREDWIHVVEV